MSFILISTIETKGVKFMNWIKKGEYSSVKEVFLRNTGYSDDDLERIEKETYPITGFDKAKDILLKAIKKGEKVTVVADYDVDGVMSAFIMDRTLKFLGADYTIRIPKRFTEGYGLNESIIDEIPSGVLITVDNGIAAFSSIEKAKEKGLKVIILDHHLPVGAIPNADVVIDPNALSCAKFNGYCGAGLAYKFSKELVSDENLLIIFRICAAFATIADVVPLKEENRLIVRNGLKDASAYAYLLPKGFYTLISSFYLLDHISEKDVGFKIAPAINACGRLCDDGGAKILRALLENNERVIDDVIATNERRKILTRDLTEKAEMEITAEGLNNSYPLLLYIPKAPLGIIGLVASAVSEKYKRPAFVVSDCGDILKGSGRTYGNKNIKQMLDDSSEFLLGYGGHAAAAGISLKKEDLGNLREALSKAYGEIEEPDPNVYYDLEINEASFKNILDELEKYMPYGEGNPEIVFRINNYKIHPNQGRDYILMGKDRSIIKFQGINSDAIGFDCLPKYEMLGKPDRLNLIGTLSYNYFRGSRRATIEIIDIECA